MTAILSQRHTPSHRSGTRASRPSSARRDLLSNVLFLASLWAGYAVVRGVTSGDFAVAADNAAAIIDLQRSFGLPNEADLQAAVLDHTSLIRFSNVYYIGVHFPITIGLLAWAWRNHRDKFARLRNALVMTTAAGLVIHVSFPLLPPRMMDGFVDTAQTVGPDPYALGVSGGANQLAAMPSLHVGWALLVAASVVWMSTSPARWLIVAHPIVTLLVVVVTANHYWADALVAMLIVITAWRFTQRNAAAASSASGSSAIPRHEITGTVALDPPLVLETFELEEKEPQALLL